MAAIPSVIGTLLGASDFCSIYSFPTAGLCVGDPTVPKEERDESTGYGSIPAWCLASSDLPYCNREPLSEPVKITEPMCFDTNYNVTPCKIFTEKYCATFQFYNWSNSTYGSYTTYTDYRYNNQYNEVQQVYVPCNDFVTCLDLDGKAISCNIKTKEGYTVGSSPWNDNIDTRGCVDTSNNVVVPCTKQIRTADLSSGNTSLAIDKYLRVVDPATGIPKNDSSYIGGYPTEVVNPPPPPEPVRPPFDPGANPFDPPFPVVPDGEECAGIVCECIALVVNALGAVNNTLLKIDESVLSVVGAVQDKVIEFPNGDEVEPVETVPFDDKDILDKLAAILKSIDDISVEVTKEAGTNFWDVLGGAFGDIFDLIEFLIEKVIYLVVPEDTSNINTAFETLNGLISAKMKPVEQIKTAVDGAMNVETKTFEDIYITLPAYGEVKFFETDYIQIALPYVRRILSAMMILMTAFYAYRKVSSEMIR